MGKIAVIDDARADIQMITSILEEADHDVVAYREVNDLEARLQVESPDLILLDIVMPRRNGFEILRSLKKNAGTTMIPVVLVSSKREPTDLAWGKRQGADGYVTKPFTAEELLSEVGRFIR